MISSIAMQFSDVVHHMEEVQKLCHEQAVVRRGLKCVQLVYGSAGEWYVSSNSLLPNSSIFDMCLSIPWIWWSPGIHRHDVVKCMG